jgi:ribosome-binding ATPase
VICAQAEADIAELEGADRIAFLHDLGLEEPGLATLSREAYALLDLDTFFTAGPTRSAPGRSARDEGATGGRRHPHRLREGLHPGRGLHDPRPAGHGSEAALRAAGKIRVEGKDYVVRDGDVIYFFRLTARSTSVTADWNIRPRESGAGAGWQSGWNMTRPR